MRSMVSQCQSSGIAIEFSASKTKEAACVDKSAKLETLRTAVRRQMELEAIAADEFQLRAKRAPRARLLR